MLKSNFEFEIMVHGSPAKEYYHDGKYYIEGKEGSRFSLRMRNSSSHRALFVPTVDGMSIMNGKQASYKSQGYVINAYDSLTIDGWRTSDKNVAEFFFSSPKESYASKTNKTTGNLGVIGCAVFKEKERKPETIVIKEYIQTIYPNHWPYYPYYNYPYNYGGGVTYNSLNSSGGVSTDTNGGITGAMNTNTVNAMYACSAGSQQVSAGNNSVTPTNAAALGTGFGQDKNSPVSTVDFDKESSPSEVFTIFYNTKENLEAAGVEFKKAVYIAPSAFPNEDGYCERPN